MNSPKKMGRPPKAETEKKTERLEIRLTSEESEALKGLASKLGISRTEAILKGLELLEKKK
jgi:predicted DNA binding CopG/RHH family protein